MSIDLIANLGDDALANLFDMTLPVISDITELDTNVRLRIQNFTIPATGAETYDVHYRTQKMTKVGGKVDAPNEFSFDFRVDKNYNIYRAFKTWKNFVANSSTGVIMNDGSLTSPYRGPIIVYPVDSSGVKTITGVGWVFAGCFVQNIGDISFDYTSGEPITVTVTMGYARMDDTVF